MANRSGRVRPVVGAVAFFVVESSQRICVASGERDDVDTGGVECSQAKGKRWSGNLLL